MSQFKEFKNNLHPNYLELKERILHPETMWTRNASDPVGMQPSDRVWYCHNIISRAITGMNYARPTSSLAQLASEALAQILHDNREGFEIFHRVAVNIMPRQATPFAPRPHEDHSFPYRHMLIYLNDSDGDTVMFNGKGKVIDRSSPKEDKIIHFGKCWHNGYYPLHHAERIVLVATYN